MSATTSRISRLQLVMIPSTEQDRSVAFYQALGFETRNDIPWGDGYRWVEVYPPEGTAGIALVPPRPGDPTSIQTGIILNTDDIDAAHEQLRSSGVDVDAEVARPGSPAAIRLGAVEMAGPVPPMFWFRDPDGNALLIVEAKWPDAPSPDTEGWSVQRNLARVREVVMNDECDRRPMRP